LKDGKPIWVAEIGINHNGSLQTAFELIDLAKKHGFDYVKFQKRDIDLCYTKEYLDSLRESPWGITQREQKLGLEFTFADYCFIDSRCSAVGIKWFYSPWDVSSAEQMEQFNCDYVKIAKASLTNKELINYFKLSYTPLVCSINYDTDMRELAYIWEQTNLRYILSCVSLYPSPLIYTGLENISRLKEDELLIGDSIGYSNHSPHWVHPVIASHLGAEMIEVHITLDKKMYGSDQASSLDDSDLTQMMQCAKKELPFDAKLEYVKQEKEVLGKLRQTW
jgi:N-acetylneuraminate synthase